MHCSVSPMHIITLVCSVCKMDCTGVSYPSPRAIMDTTNNSDFTIVPMPSAVTRVMSPNQPSDTLDHMSVFLGHRAACQVCNIPLDEPVMCAGCGKYGHPACINPHRLQTDAGILLSVLNAMVRFRNRTHNRRFGNVNRVRSNLLKIV